MTDYSAITAAFRGFNNNIKVTSGTLDIINSRISRIEIALDKYYYSSFQGNKMLKVGSIGRQTDIHVSDVDIIYKVPQSVYARYNAYNGNGQAAMLYAFRDVVRAVYPSSYIKADGLVAVVNFADGVAFELMPGIERADGSFNYPVSNVGGYWGKTDPIPEINAMNRIHRDTERNAKKLARMVRSWKDKNNVGMGGLLIDTYVYRFLENYKYKDKGYAYYDWMSRDFFSYLSRQNDDAAYTYALGSNQLIYLKKGFAYRAKEAYNHAVNAIDAYEKGYYWTSKNHWQSIFGNKFPDFS